jgi:hypothetical protein
MSAILHSFTDRDDDDAKPTVRVAEFTRGTAEVRAWVGLHIASLCVATDNPDLLDKIAVQAVRAAHWLREQHAAEIAANPHADKSAVELLEEMKSIPLS